MSTGALEFKWACAVGMVTFFLVLYIVFLLFLPIHPVGLRFQGSQYQTNWVLASFLLVTGALLLPMGRRADLTGRLRIFKLGLFLFLVGE